MKVKFKFSVDQLVAISFLLNECYNLIFTSLNTDQKIEVSIGCSLSDFFDKKKRKIQKNLDLLNSNKKISITLSFHEAWALKKIFINQLYLLKNDYQKLSIQSCINDLDQKLI